MKKKKILISLVLLAPAFFVTVISAKPVRFQYRPEHGRVSEYLVEVRSDLRSKKLMTVTTGRMKLEQSVLEVYEKKTRESMIFKEVDFNAGLPGAYENIDLTAINEIVGKKIELWISENGEILDMTGEEDLNLLGIKTGRLYLSNTPTFPDKEISKGDSWVFRSTSTIPIWNSLVNTDIEVRYSFAGFVPDNPDYILIEGQMIISTVTDAVKKEDEFIAEVTMSGMGRETALYDYKRSLLISSKIDMDLEGIISTEYYGEKEEYPMVLKLKTYIKLEE